MGQNDLKSMEVGYMGIMSRRVVMHVSSRLCPIKDKWPITLVNKNLSHYVAECFLWDTLFSRLSVFISNVLKWAMKQNIPRSEIKSPFHRPIVYSDVETLYAIFPSMTSHFYNRISRMHGHASKVKVQYRTDHHAVITWNVDQSECSKSWPLHNRIFAQSCQMPKVRSYNSKSLIAPCIVHKLQTERIILRDKINTRPKLS